MSQVATWLKPAVLAVLAVLVVVGVLLPGPGGGEARAHPIGLATFALEQSGQDAARWTVTWRTSARERGKLLSPSLPGGCADTGEPVQLEKVGASRVRRWAVRCPDGADGDLRADRSTDDLEILVSVVWADGRLLRGRLKGDRRIMRVKAPPVSDAQPEPGDAGSAPAAAPSVADQGGLGFFVALGFEHVLEGWDHLLFVLVLLMLAWPAGTHLRWGAIGAAITGFTLAHSATLALSVTGVLTPPGPPIETAIAWSVVVAAAALLRGHDETGGRWRRLMATAGAFGLLHGFGFAGALSEILGTGAGVNLATSLLGFNIGVELGQLAFAAGAVALGLAMGRRRYSGVGRSWVDAAAGYGVGLVAAFWTFERAADWLT